ncbi:ribonuclease HII [Nitrospina watsonii]|uniref:Ribonuclease HII n=1 Tax=Nitrospina watsonii TaxID=1323948 RepID=A0ABM9HG93_9BACT|nr:ribonuclease HII [Nitrospina watsonii]CAI2719053.1 Ribonuclease HII [Nitrospina watsonii]
MLDFEREAEQNGYVSIAGVDEAGRGPLAGPVVAAAVVLPKDAALPGLDDSKKLSPAERDRLYPLILELCCGHAIAVVDAETIDAINILQAARRAMKLAVEQLGAQADFVLIDGNQPIDVTLGQRTIVGGDGKSLSIAAASVLAKVDRDRIMDSYHTEYPQYGFNQHKGYGTQVHRDRIREWGPCPIHRKTFKGVKEYLTVTATADPSPSARFNL